MKIFSWNVNGIRAVYRKNAMQAFLKKHKPDILLIQEIKGKQEKFDEVILGDKTLRFFNPAEKEGYAGTAIFVDEMLKKDIVDVTMKLVGIKDSEGRVIKIELKNNLVVICLYMVNGGKSEEAYQYKLKFFKGLSSFVKSLIDDGKDVVIGGDFNVARSELDLSEPEKHQNHTHFNPEIRDHMQNLINVGLIDTYRERNPNKEGAFTYWDNFDFSLSRGQKPREVNKGWRLDYFLVNKKLDRKIKKASIENKVMGSDHCPILIQI